MILGLIVVLAITCLAVIVILARSVNAADLPRGLGHPKPGEFDPYAKDCCHGQHCEPVESGAIVEVPGGYQVTYLASRGFVADGFIPYGDPGILQSFNRQEHACATAQGVKCIYIHFGA
ncbi:MAG: hypothetical protein RIS45_1026 [Planctomycetota bacterium]|jgi:hypothetical protein